MNKKRKAFTEWELKKLNESLLDHMLSDRWDIFLRFRVFDGYFKGYRAIHRSFNWH